jgi:NhaA family Na+:H+ antiporter
MTDDRRPLIALAAALAVALAWSNSPWWRAYQHAAVRPAVNDGLMTVFFFVVGLEMKRELTVGRLSTRRQALLPVFAAVTGMAVPTLVYAAVVGRAGPGSRGWGVPMATDIAFAVGALAVLGPRRVPPGVRAFVLALAVADDILTVVVLAFVGGHQFHPVWLLAGAGGLGAVVVIRATGVRWPPAYLPAGVVVWAGMWAAGVEPALAGVAVAVITPVEVVPRLEDAVSPWESLLVLPVFVALNAGVHLHAGLLRPPAAARVAAGVLAARVVGKLVGITAGAWLGVRLGVGHLPEGARWRHVAGAAAMAGVGFTVPLLFAAATLPPALRAAATAALLAGSALGLVVGAAWLAWPRRQTGPPTVPPAPS